MNSHPLKLQTDRNPSYDRTFLSWQSRNLFKKLIFFSKTNFREHLNKLPQEITSLAYSKSLQHQKRTKQIENTRTLLLSLLCQKLCPSKVYCQGNFRLKLHNFILAISFLLPGSPPPLLLCWSFYFNSSLNGARKLNNEDNGVIIFYFY